MDILKKLISLSQVDSNIARITAEKKRLEADLEKKKEALDKAENAYQVKAVALLDFRKLYEREDKHIKQEQQKLIDRRKSLAHLGGDYKLQLAAEREVEHAGKQLGGQEEKLIEVLEKLSALEKDEQAAAEVLAKAKKEHQDALKEVQETVRNSNERLQQHEKERTELLTGADRKDLAIYDRVRSRFPMDPVVPILNHTCQGCFMGLGPQATLQVSRGTALIRCRGCGRIIYIKSSQEE